VHHGVAPGPADEQVPADAALLDHPEFGHELVGDRVVRGARSPQPVQAEPVEAEPQQQPAPSRRRARGPTGRRAARNPICALCWPGWAVSTASRANPITWSVSAATEVTICYERVVTAARTCWTSPVGQARTGRRRRGASVRPVETGGSGCAPGPG
jgi:hypothetical protein